MLTGSLDIDGIPVDAASLRRTFDDVERCCANLGAGPGHAVVTACRTGLGVLATVVAARRLGAAVAFAPPAADRGLTARLEEVSAAQVVERGGTLEVLPRARAGEAVLPPGAAAVFPTSGSTGRPRLVVLSHAGLAYQSGETASRLGLSEADSLLVPLPLAHAYGMGIVMMWLERGGRLLLETSFSAADVTGRLLSRDVTTLDGVPSMYSILLKTATREPEVAARLRRLRIRGIGGDVLHPAMAARFSALGADLHDGYGLTEAGPNVAISAPGAMRPGTVGTPLSGTEVRRDAATGELLIRTPSLMLGYLGEPDATAAALTADGWLRSGDVGEVEPDGHVRVLGRLKEVLIVDGETHAPTLIEDVFRALPGVAEACVLGVRSADDASGRGDRIVAFVELADPVSVTDLRTLCRRDLPPRLRPRDIHVDVPLPRTGTGKVDRTALRRWVTRETSARHA
ncbi:class I adenylate-forming enzyme family protein [Streptomyces guryensis]|uniref:Acyl--CoA ligase n=1 Tax=Streptomyces guryensis TaxID=2886947 RepID=A0A9Q3VYR8_9ACTN|nr:class I adenylate-forming enzyme family protein [Streptomyces guryensis]MCD9880202.1 acyl--CoA ligase [Streptomyces guryensis]